MLAVFSDSVAHGPEALASPGPKRCSSSELASIYRENHKDVMYLNLEENSFMAYTHHRQPLLTPRSFAALDDIFCMFEGTLENLAALRQQYGLSKSVNESLLVIEAYKALRDRAPYPPHQVVGDLSGRFAFVLFDNHSKKIFVGKDMAGKVPLFWGTTSDGLVAFSDDESLLRRTCGNGTSAFPQGCYFSSDDGLRSYEHPLQEVTAVPQIDSQGQTYGATFKVDFQRTLSRERSGRMSSWGVA
ncbi:hypothetical protein KP509_09G094600 [Ceratopteris richardii]|uniref:DUF3700 domain-containing protein n=1 Tax=Ceratopteris richardii TaxID=49495 RepID=A0A8T2UAJ4_CERRI|nr:hypothetical protein KP509_09G094600 [Ceratopteris richardii]KAH7430344.1 hypothetical protein KP509_09G094600 [Ceratopteris richardii]